MRNDVRKRNTNKLIILQKTQGKNRQKEKEMENI